MGSKGRDPQSSRFILWLSIASQVSLILGHICVYQEPDSNLSLWKDPTRQKEEHQVEEPCWKAEFVLQNGDCLYRSKFHYNKAAFQNGCLCAEICSFSKYPSYNMPKKYMNGWGARIFHVLFLLHKQFYTTETSRSNGAVSLEFCLYVCVHAHRCICARGGSFMCEHVEGRE